MKMNHGYFGSLFLLMMLMTKISHCQEGIPIAAGKDCPEMLIEKWMTADGISVADSLERFLYESGFPFAVTEVTKEGMGESKISVECGPQIRYVRILWRQDSSWYAMPGEEQDAVLPWEETGHHRAAALHRMADSGFPYARLHTFPQKVAGDTLVLEYGLDSVRTIRIGEIRVSGDFNIHLPMFQSMIGLQEDQPFDAERIRRSREIIRSWDFGELERIHYDFHPTGVDLEFVMREKSPSRFDLLLALIPSMRPERQYELTGNAYIDLQNQLKRAERIFFRFDKYANSSQSLELRLNFPYLGFLRSGVLAEGGLDRRDSSVMDVEGRLGLQYSRDYKRIWSVYMERKQSRLISVEEEWLKRNGLLPEELDYNYTAGGVSLENHLLDQRMNPRKGSFSRIGLSAGIRKIIRNGQIIAIRPEGAEAVSFDRQYDEVAKSVVRTSAFASRDQFFPVGLYSTFRVRVMGEWIWGPEGLLENEKLRPGGFQDFRGFPEKSFLADGYGAGTLEYRFLFGPESNAYVFSDFGVLYQEKEEGALNFPYGFGIGLNLGTKAGVFGISYAVGGHRDVPFSFSQSRVNFGLMVNY